ncbi:MAG: hypothetical protein LBK13_09140 [Spirochaetales bacterium]|jgi:hypothetical protein|nr:hypothetical protein [Spirochaetales bacterium]
MTIEYGSDETVKEEYEVTQETSGKINFMSFYYNGSFMNKTRLATIGKNSFSGDFKRIC